MRDPYSPGSYRDFWSTQGIQLQRALLCAFCLLLAVSSFANAQEAAKARAKSSTPTVVTVVTAKQLTNFLREEGFAAKFDENAEDGNVVEMKINGQRAVAFVWDEGKTIEFYMGFKDQTLTLSAINEWSHSNRVSRISIDENGTASMSMRLHLNGGVTPGWIVIHAAAFREEFEAFEKVMQSK